MDGLDQEGANACTAATPVHCVQSVHSSVHTCMHLLMQLLVNLT